MQRLTYREAYDKIIQAYFRNEIRPYDSDFCFCGTLHGNGDWNNGYRLREDSPYSLKEYKRMELKLLETITNYRLCGFMSSQIADPRYEDALFNGMCAALEVLKEIHRERGENVDDEIPVFTKRSLSVV